MKQKTLAAIILVMITVTLFAGCSKEPPKQQAVVLNLATVGEKTGISEQWNKHRKTINQQISEEIKTLSAKLSKEIEDEKSSLVDKPSEEGDKKIQTLLEQKKKKITQARKEGNSRRAKEISEIRQSFVDDIMSFAQKVASEHGASIILTAMAVHWSDGSVDITDEVIARMNGVKDTLPAGSVQN